MLNLTRQERQVILFLVSVALAGAGIDFFAKRNSTAKTFLCSPADIGRVNLNQADKETLMDISGIGEKISQRIIEYRQQNGAFQEIEELKKIKGITDYRFEKLKDSLFIK